MKKKLLSVLLSVAMVATCLAGCGAKEEAAAPAEEAAAEEAVVEEAPVEAAEEAVAEETPAEETAEGSNLNIYCWNEEFKTRLTDHYPGYEEIDATTGKIGDVTVNWFITPSENNAYQNNLDENLLKQADAAADDKIDMFLVEADYAVKYVDTEYTMALADLGIADADLADQYQYTKDVMTASNGQIKGASWQGCPGVLIYNREAAKEVLGTDDPAEVQESVKDWDTFLATADKMKTAGYKMTASAVDTYRVFSNNTTSKWVENGVINYDANIEKWVELSKEMVTKEYTEAHELWSEDWSKGFYPDGKVFCYFGPAWFVDFSMAADAEGSIANLGGWGATEGPQGFFWGGTWICPATGTDNAATIKDIIIQMTTNADLMTGIVKKDNDFVNNKPAMDAMAADTSYSSAVLGGQNPLGKYCAGVETISLKNLTIYDQGCNEEFQTCMLNYFKDNATYEDAIAQFEKTMGEKYPELAK